jgi:hypothetical protein
METTFQTPSGPSVLTPVTVDLMASPVAPEIFLFVLSTYDAGTRLLLTDSAAMPIPALVTDMEKYLLNTFGYGRDSSFRLGLLDERLLLMRG